MFILLGGFFVMDFGLQFLSPLFSLLPQLRQFEAEGGEL